MSRDNIIIRANRITAQAIFAFAKYGATAEQAAASFRKLGVGYQGMKELVRRTKWREKTRPWS